MSRRDPALNGKHSRRRFLDTLLGTSAVAWLGAILYPIYAYLRPPEDRSEAVSSVAVGGIEEIPPDSAKIFQFGRRPAILIRDPNGDFKAFSAVCTHLDCTVQYRKDLGLIWCACHNGRYNLNGVNVAGPPPRPLEEYRVDIQGDQIYVSKMS
jgi:Rieske Fe-S protein